MKKLFQFITSKSIEIEVEMDRAIVGADYQRRENRLFESSQ
jgi:hypothetical protein